MIWLPMCAAILSFCRGAWLRGSGMKTATGLKLISSSAFRCFANGLHLTLISTRINLK